MLRTLPRCVSAKAGIKRRADCAALLLDYGQGLPAASVGQSVYSMATGNIFWRGHAWAGCVPILSVDMAREGPAAEILEMDWGALAGAAGRLRPSVV